MIGVEKGINNILVTMFTSDKSIASTDTIDEMNNDTNQMIRQKMMCLFLMRSKSSPIVTLSFNGK